MRTEKKKKIRSSSDEHEIGEKGVSGRPCAETRQIVAASSGAPEPSMRLIGSKARVMRRMSWCPRGAP
jgi:hypothetical protein